MPFNPDLLGMSNPQESYQIQASQHSEDQVHQAPAKLPETHQGQNSDSLCIIPEFGPASAVPALATLRAGGRRGPLAKDKASMIAKTRREKKVCIRCKQNKVSCTGGGPCDRCRALAKATLWDQPCLKAHFADVIQSGTCNFISQRSVNYLTSDGSRRITTLLPETFELEKLLGLLKDRQGLFNIRTRQSSGPIYTLDLAGCYAFLARLKATHSLPDKSDLRDFIDRVLPRVSGWKRCVKGYDTSEDILTKLLRWNTVPSRASYDMIPITGGGPIVTMDIENPNHESDIYVAAQLSRIVCRSLEIQAFNTLQHRLNKQAWKEDPEEAKDFVKALGEILLTMRWRTPWWGTLGDGSNTDDIRKQRFIHRVQELTKILYFYFCNAKRKLPSFTDAKGLLGAEIEYKENVPEFDEFPSIDSTQGFETWMRQGRPVDWTRRLKVLRHGFRTLSVT
ncbi:hypothetical protein H2201_006741 [Coniosporium apollinis]|uniref:Zn(2)-C6 fungal-type domain-containing protein n=1 Tax=Coniosporium apollinis TaxID=61459 RepID=A0ABQ9NL94_9PEZI|nr:hypothetical protein H2201_006741 [Coniosporium apollinis]